MTSREAVIRAIRFQGPDHLPHHLPEPYGSDLAFTAMSPSPDWFVGSGTDEWGCVWDNIGSSQLGEVKYSPLQDWADFAGLPIPDIHQPSRWSLMPTAREEAGDKFLIGFGMTLYHRATYLRGVENLWADIYEEPEQVAKLLDILVEMNLVAIAQYAAAGVDAFFIADDWGLQDRLMIAPAKWRELWKPRYARLFQAAHDGGMLTFLHSCGYIVDILDDLIEIGLNVIHMDQQENMGLELLGSRFGGRLAFYSPVDIQQTMCHGSLDDIRAYARRMVTTLGSPAGGFIARWYEDPTGAGHRPEAVTAMCEAFLEAGRELYGQ